MTDFDEPTEEELRHRLSQQDLRGPRLFMGRALAKYSLNASGLVPKVLGFLPCVEIMDALAQLAEYPELRPVIEPRLIEHDFLLLTLLAELHCETPGDKPATYARVLSATDNPVAYRARVAQLIDDATPADRREARRLVDAILNESTEAETRLAEKKSAADSPVPSRTKARSSSGPSPRKPAGAGKRSAGS